MFLKLKIWLYIATLKNFYGFGNISTKLIYAQAVHETGRFTSAIFKENNNLFGMRQAKVRKNFATGTNRAHATYKNLFNSVRDYFERQKDFKINSGSDTEFIDSTISSNYAEDKAYKTKWLATVQTVKAPFNAMLLIALFFFLLVSFFYVHAVQSNTNNKIK